MDYISNILEPRLFVYYLKKHELQHVISSHKKSIIIVWGIWKHARYIFYNIAGKYVDYTGPRK